MGRQQLSCTVRGLDTRWGQLNTWANRALKRIDGLNPYARRISTYGARDLLQEGRTILSNAINKLKWDREYVVALREGDVTGLTTLYDRLMAIETSIRVVDQRVLPVMLSRTHSDTKYDDFARRLLEDLGFKDCFPVTTHNQHAVSGLKVDMSFAQPIFLFSPSIRSFDALSLLFHEIGHLFFKNTLEENARADLARQLAPLDPQWPADAETTTKKLEEIALSRLRSDYQTVWGLREEIIADAFAGLTGGHSFTSSLCNSLLFKRGIDVSTDKIHPPAIWRLWLSRRASRLGGSPVEDDQGPPFAAWDAVAGLPQNAEREPLLRKDEYVVDRFLKRLQGMLVRNGIRLNTSMRPSDLTPRSAKCRAVLLTASRRRAASEWPEYANWERKAASKVMRTPAMSYWRWATWVIRRYLATLRLLKPLV